MKRVLLAIFFVSLWVLSPSSANAQFKIGIKIGANVSKASISQELFTSKNRLGFVAGPILDFKIPLIGLGFDLAAQYNCKYSQLDATEDLGIESGTPMLHNIDIPLNIKWTFGDDDIVSAYIATGPQISWNIGGESLKEVLDMKNYTMKNSQFSWNIGGGLNIVSNFRLGYTYNIPIGATAEVDFSDLYGEVKRCRLRNPNHQIFLVHFF